VAAAAIYAQQNGDPAQLDSQPWDDSVRALSHYPEIVEWMAQNPDWTDAVGAEFLAQPADVIQSIQRLRAEARASGALVDSPEQIVIVDGDGNIEIEPAQSEVIYVPRYDPAVVYAGGLYDNGAGPLITYGDPYPVGIWLTFGFDWRSRAIWVGDWSTWHDSSGWRHPNFRSSGAGNGRRWSLPANRPRPEMNASVRSRWQSAPPKPMRGAPPTPPRNAVRLPQDNRRPNGSAPPAAPGNDRRETDSGVRSSPEQSAPRGTPIGPAAGAPGHEKPAAQDKKADPKAHQEKKAEPQPKDDRKDQDNR
jgi:hypothetical protein